MKRPNDDHANPEDSNSTAASALEALLVRALPQLQEHLLLALDFFEDPVFVVLETKKAGASQHLFSHYHQLTRGAVEVHEGIAVVPNERKAVTEHFSESQIQEAVAEVPHRQQVSVVVVSGNHVSVIEVPVRPEHGPSEMV